MKAYIFVILLALPPVASADFVIEAQKRDQATKPYDSVMLYDNGVKHLLERGTGEASVLSGDVTGIPLPAALPLLLPEGWKAYGEEAGIGEGAVVDWRDGETWTEVLDRTGSIHDLTFEVDWNSREVYIRPSDEEGAFAALTMTPSVPIAPEVLEAERVGANVVTQSDLQLAEKTKRFTFPIFTGESLRDVLRRLAADFGYSRGLLDLRDGSVDPNYIRVPRNISIQGDNIAELAGNLSRVVEGAMPGLGLFEVQDGESVSLLLSNYNYNSWDKLAVVPVKSGSVKSNAQLIVELYGWITPSTAGWQTEQNYPISVPYSLICKDLSHCLSRLLRRYPIQAQQMETSKTVIFVQRAQPQLQRLTDI